MQIVSTPPMGSLPLVRQRMTKSGTWTTDSTSPTIVPAWTSDAGYPATISADQMVVQGSGHVIVIALVDITGTSGSAGADFELRVGGVVVASISGAKDAGAYALMWSGAVTHGQMIGVYGSRNASINARTVQPTSYVDVQPVAITRQRMVKSGSTTAAQNPVTGFFSDTANPGVVVGNKLVVKGAGVVKVTATATIATTWQGASDLTLYRNGTAIGTVNWPVLSSASSKTIEVADVTVADGDLIHLGVTGSGITMSAATVEIAP